MSILIHFIFSSYQVRKDANNLSYQVMACLIHHKLRLQQITKICMQSQMFTMEYEVVGSGSIMRPGSNQYEVVYGSFLLVCITLVFVIWFWVRMRAGLLNCAGGACLCACCFSTLFGWIVTSMGMVRLTIKTEPNCRNGLKKPNQTI